MFEYTDLEKQSYVLDGLTSYLSNKLNAMGTCGLSDEIRATDEYKKIKPLFNKYFKSFQDVNKLVMKEIKSKKQPLYRGVEGQQYRKFMKDLVKPDVEKIIKELDL